MIKIRLSGTPTALYAIISYNEQIDRRRKTMKKEEGEDENQG